MLRPLDDLLLFDDLKLLRDFELEDRPLLLRDDERDELVRGRDDADGRLGRLDLEVCGRAD